MENKFVSVIIPCRNEGKFIRDCLDSVLAQDYPKENMEILVVDGMSKDETRNIIKEYSQKYPFIKMIDNPKGITPCALNLGIKESAGEMLIRLDAHAKYDKNYISKCLEYSKKYNADNVGGILKTIPKKDTLAARAIALSLSSSFGAGNSAFRVGISEPVEADTVFGGCFKKDIFGKVGLFNENLVRSQDMEFNMRLKRSGGKIILAPDIVSYYYPKSNLKDYFVHNIKDGIWAVYPLKFIKAPLKLRHYIPLIFVLTLPLSIWPYIPASLYVSFKIAKREKDWKLFFMLPLVFFTRHFAYGLGSLFGAIKLIFKK